VEHPQDQSAGQVRGAFADCQAGWAVVQRDDVCHTVRLILQQRGELDLERRVRLRHYRIEHGRAVHSSSDKLPEATQRGKLIDERTFARDR
jgi:hypothetical protein